MRPTAPRSHKAPVLSVAWRQAEYRALQANAADTCDDRVSEEIYDLDDERAEVDSIVHGMPYRLN